MMTFSQHRGGYIRLFIRVYRGSSEFFPPNKSARFKAPQLRTEIREFFVYETAATVAIFFFLNRDDFTVT